MPAVRNDVSLDLESVEKSKKRDDRILSDPEISSRSRDNLITLLSEGHSMISKVDTTVVDRWMEAVCANGNLRSPLPAVLCHEVRRRVEEDASSKDLGTQSYRTLGELLARGKALLDLISQKNDVDCIWKILDDISGPSPIATLLYYDFISSMPDASGDRIPPLTERVKGDLSTLVREGRDLLSGISAESSATVLSTIKQHANTSPLAKILYLEMLGQQFNEEGLTERSQARLEELLEQGVELLCHLSESQAEQIRSSIIRASGVSPVAAVLYKRLLSAVAKPGADDAEVEDHDAAKEVIAEEGQECLKEIIADGDHIMKEMTETDAMQSMTAKSDPGRFNSGRLASLRMEFHDIKDLLASHGEEFMQIIRTMGEDARLSDSLVVDAISSVSGLRHVERDDIVEVVRSFSQNGSVIVSDLFNSLRLQEGGQWEEIEEDMGDTPNLTFVEAFVARLTKVFGDLEEAREALEMEGMVYIAAFEYALHENGITGVDVLRLLSDLGLEDEEGCFDGDELFYLLCGNAGASLQDEAQDQFGDCENHQSSRPAEETPAEQVPDEPALAEESESDDDEFIEIQPRPDLHSQRTSGVPRAGMGLSVYTASLESSVRALKGKIAQYDRRNNDPNIRGSRAWRLWNMERQLAQHTVEAQQNRKAVSPQSSYSLINKQQSSSILGDREKSPKSRDRVGPLLTLARSPAPKRSQPRAKSDLSTANLVQRNLSNSSFGSISRSSSAQAMKRKGSSVSDDLPQGLVKEIREHRAEALAAAGGEQYGELHVNAAIKIQSLFRGIRDREMVRPLLRQHVTSAISIIYFRKMKVSELNTIFRSVRDSDRVGESLAVEASNTQGILDEMFAKESAECEAADKKAEKELVELEEAEREAEQEVEEANVAQERMQKERDEMLAWQAKADRYRASYEQLKASKGIEDDQDDSLRVLHPDVFREKNQWQGIYQRYQREREQYENAMAIMIKEKNESDRALYKAAQERKEWKEARAQALKERQEVEAFVLARKFTDPQVSLKERFRAKVKSSADAPRYVRKTEPPKGEAVYLGVIQVDEENAYEGEFIVVKDLPEEELSSVFFSMCDEDDALDLEALQRAMLGVGRRLNLNEAERLVKSFDTDGNGTIEFDEFLAGFRRMVGMELPHGMGVERFGDGTLYEGEIFEDKRIGIGMYTTAGPDQQWYLGGWHLGHRQGKGIEGRFTSKGVMVPVAVVQCHRGARKCRERFNPEKEWHLRMLREYSLVVDTARKKAAKARLTVQGDIQLGLNRKSAHAVEIERFDTAEEDEQAHAEHSMEHHSSLLADDEAYSPTASAKD